MTDARTALGPCWELAESGDVDLKRIIDTLDRIDITPEQLDALALEDPDHPYGRRVLFADEKLEVMVATWTRDFPCAPHDHGGSVGAVRVLRGRARHKIWAVVDGELKLQRQHRADSGEVMVCGREMVHSMGDDDAEGTLMTLHLYTDPIEKMVVYDTDNANTLVVDGGCGAWVPHDEPDLIKRTLSGLIPRDEVLYTP